MGIRSDNHVSGNCQSFFRKKRMLDPHFSHLEIVGDLVAVCKLSHAFAVLRRFNILVRDKMIGNEGDLILVKNAVHLHFFHFPDGYRACDIIAKHQIQIRLNELAGFHPVKPRMRRQYFLGHCHSHDLLPPVIIFVILLTESDFTIDWRK